MTIDLPKPQFAIYPDSGVEIYGFSGPEGNYFTRHDDTMIRVWKGHTPILGELTDAWPYYTIDDSDMDEGELWRAVCTAVTMLEMPLNRKTKRAMNA